MTEQGQMKREGTTRSDEPTYGQQQPASERRSESTERQATSAPTGADPGERSGNEGEADTAGSQAATPATESLGEADAGDDRAPLFPTNETERFRQRWEKLQAGFVDQPRQVVAEADELVNELMQQLTAGFSDKRAGLEAQWEQGEQVSTEDLRVTLTRYRSFFNRLLSV